MDQNTVCNLGTYNRRVWCRAEVFSLYCRQGFEDMHIAVEPDASYQLINVDEDQFCDTFLVFERDCPRLGTFCCKRAGRARLDALDALYFTEGRSVAFPLTRMTDRGTIFAAALPLFLKLEFPRLSSFPEPRMEELHIQTFSFYVMVISSCAVFAILMLFTILSRTFRRML